MFKAGLQRLGPIGSIKNQQLVTATTLPLDVITGAVGAYSMRKLRSAYAGYAIRVRRSSDNTEQDIGFSSGDLDTATLLSFVGAGSGYLSKIYDQTGNSRTLAQTTASLQPQIVNAGSLVTSNSRTCPDFMGVATMTANGYTAAFSGLTAGTMIAVYRDRTASKNFAIANQPSTTDAWTRFSGAGYTGMFVNLRYSTLPASVPVGINHLEVYRCDNSQNYNLRRNGTEILNTAMAGRTFTVTDSFALSPSNLGTPAASSDKTLDGWFFEMLVFPSYLSLTDTQTLETDITSYWGIT